MIDKKWLVLIALVFSGAAALIYQVAASESLLYFFSSSSYSVATVLSSYMFGLAAGSLIMSRFLARIKNKILAFAAIELFIGTYALIFFKNFEWLPGLVINSEIRGLALVLAKFGISFAYLMVPTLMLGALFPLATSIYVSKKKMGEGVGVLYSVDTFGAIIGSFFAGFFLIPFVGIADSIIIGAVLSYIAGMIVLIKNVKWASFYSAACIIMLLFAFFNTSGSQLMITGHAVKEISNDNIIFQRNSAYGPVTITDENGSLYLYTGKRTHCTSASDSDAVFADILKEFDREVDVLHIGLGCGHTLNGILKFDNVRSVDVVEINDMVVEACREYFCYNNVLEDKRVRLFVEDGASFLRRGGKKYDAIILTVQVPAAIHSSPLYTVEYFNYAKEMLEDDGILTLYSIFSYEGDVILYYTLKESFDFVYPKLGRMSRFVASSYRHDIEMNLHEYKLLDKLNSETQYMINTMDNQILRRFHE